MPVPLPNMVNLSMTGGPPPRVVGVILRQQPAESSAQAEAEASKQRAIHEIPNKSVQKMLEKLESADLATFAETSARIKCMVNNVINDLITREKIIWNNGAFHEVVTNQEGHVNPTPASDMTPEQMIASIVEAIAGHPRLAYDQNYIIPY